MTITQPRQLTYDHALSAIRGPWRGILAIVSFIVGFLIISSVVGGAGIIFEIARGEVDLDQLAQGIVPLTPAIMLTNNLSLAASIPLAILLQRAFFGVKGGWLSSVTGAFRWRWMWRLALIIVPVWAVYVGISLIGTTDEVRIDGAVLLMLAIVIVTTPLQAAGEEYGARGLILRSAGSWFANPIVAFVVGTVISSAVFASAHFAGDLWLIAYYFVFGASAAIAARGTGGLEAPVLVHATNNVLLFIPAALFGQLDQGIDRSEGTGGPFMLIPMALCVAAALFSTWWARRSGIATKAGPPPTTVGARIAGANPALSFGRAVDQYEAARPTYPAGTAEWLVPAGATTVVDLGAGTGKFTRSLTPLAASVIAVEPDFAMLERLGATVPGIRAVPGTAEAIPLPDGSVDVVVAAQAWHWVDEARALPEVARVLKPGGTLGLVWNIRDESVPWVRALTTAMGDSAAERRMREPVVIGAPFGETQSRVEEWTREFTPESLLQLVASRSAFITADQATQQRILASVRELLATDPALAGKASFEMPYRTYSFRSTLG